MKRSITAAVYLLVCSPALGATCSLTVQGQSYIDGPCEFTPLDGGDFQISDGRSFAYVYVDGSMATGFWNGTEYASHAHDPLGELRRDGACWVAADASVCAYQ